MAELTPMKRQYLAIKDQHPDCLLFFRLGDFYEMFDEDAKTAAAELNLTLTTRDRNKPPEERTPMCGVPYHSVESYIARLISKGYKVAICEQMEDPALAKGLVDRDIIRIVTPGTVIESSMLEEGRNNFLCSICLQEPAVGVCFCDISTGEVSATAFAGKDAMEHLWNELGRYAPREAVLSPAAAEDPELRAFYDSAGNLRRSGGHIDLERAGGFARYAQFFALGDNGGIVLLGDGDPLGGHVAHHVVDAFDMGNGVAHVD